jgi:outer membrane receptor protein involved in Fe transport
MHWAKRVAQAAPVPDQPPAGGDQPAPEGAPAPAPDPAQPPPPEPTPAAPPPEAAPAPAANVETTPNLSDEELKKLAEESAKEEVITVTGSTIERKTLTTPAPLTILNREDLNATGRSTVGDIIQQLPAQSNAINAQVNNGGNGATRVNIRGLGTARTLTLVNGRRVVPGGTGADASVDLNSIPLAVIERVEVLKDGASAIYGSDAIGGVVNIITRTDFEGTEVALYTGGTQHGDGFTYDASFVTGHNAENKKGNIIFSAGIQSQDPVFAGDRSFSTYDLDFDFAARQSSIGGSISAPGGRIDTTKIDINGDGKGDPNINLCGKDVQFCTANANGTYRPFVQPDDLYNYQPVNYLYTPSSRYNLYSAGTYKFRPEVSGFFEASYLNRTSDQQLAPEPFSTLSSKISISKDSVYNKLRDVDGNPIGGDVLVYNRRLEEFGPRKQSQSVDTFRIVGGFQGSVPEEAAALKNWKWELSYNFGRTDAIQKNQGSLIVSRLKNALGPSFIDPATNVPTCGTATAPIAKCVPMNILGPSGSIDPAAAAYTTYTGVSNGYNEQQTVLATSHGRIAKLPNNGDISLAVGGDYRKEAGGFTPDPLTSTGDTTGNAQAPTDGSYSVFEGFSELSIVPISGQKYAEWVELNLAARAFRYDSFGSGVTWKAGGLFRTINGVALRGTYSTAFRAPSVNELFRGKTDNNPSVEDPCDTKPKSLRGGTKTLSPTEMEKCAAAGVPANAAFGTNQQREVNSGNSSLEAETAKVITAGIVVEPPQVKGLGFTIDYWNVDISNAIQALNSNVILPNCYVQGIDAYCQRIHRLASQGGAIDYIDNPQSNVGGTSTSGLDTAITYDHQFGSAGRFREQLEGQYLFKYNLDNSFQIIHGRGVYDLGVFPKYKANFSTAWQHPMGIGGGFNFRFVGSYKECKQNDCNHGQARRDVDSWYKVDLYGTYAFKNAAGRTSISAGVNNLLNRNPSLIYIGFAGDSDAATYDYLGRFFYARLSQMF